MNINTLEDRQAEGLDNLESATTPANTAPPDAKLSDFGGGSDLDILHIEPWPTAVDGALLLTDIAKVLRRFVVLPKHAEETLALWVLHTYAFKLRDATTYIGVESPEKRCGKTTLLTALNELVSRPVVASNISSSAFFRVIEEIQPTLLIDEADTFLQGNDELRGILNAGYKRKTAFVVRVTNEARLGRPRDGIKTSNFKLQTSNSHVETRDAADGRVSLLTPLRSEATAGQASAATKSRLVKFSCWCPKVVAAIGRLPDTLADRCVVIRMHRKTAVEECERMRNLDTTDLRRQCARFVKDHAGTIASAQPEIPEGLNDRAADIWEPLFSLADLAGEDWPRLAREAAVGLTSRSNEMNPIAALLLDILIAFARSKKDKLATRDLVQDLNAQSGRPWAEQRNGKPITDLWLAQQLRPYGIRPRYIWLDDANVRGYLEEDFRETFRRYIPKAEARAYLDEITRPRRMDNGAARPTNGTNEH
jgi:hypothetical protein